MKYEKGKKHFAFVSDNVLPDEGFVEAEFLNDTEGLLEEMEKHYNIEITRIPGGHFEGDYKIL